MAETDHGDLGEPKNLIAMSEHLSLDQDGFGTAKPNPNSRRGQGGARGGGREKGKRGEPQGRDVSISKALSKLLRHDAVKEGLVLDDEGFAGVVEVLQWPRLKSLKATFADIQHAVSSNAKQRFALKPIPGLEPAPSLAASAAAQWLIRANQGHSIAGIASAALLTPITLAAGNIPDVVVHGTYFGIWDEIVKSGGLKKMGRNHVHFGTGVPGEGKGKDEVVSGMRGDAEVLIFVDVKRSLEDGKLEWWQSENGVILSEGDENGIVSSEYWKEARGRRGDVGILWKDGKEVMSLPENLKARRVPTGKGGARDRGAKGGRGGRGGRGGGAAGVKAEHIKQLNALGGEIT